MSYDTILYDVDEGVATITLNRPEVRNALSFELIEELNHAVKAADRASDVRCIVIAGAGPSFCSGHDLSAQGLADYVEKAPNLECLWEMEEDFYLNKHGLDIWYSDTPTIARVQGNAILGGFVLANVCDLIVCAEDAVFWVPALRMHNMGAEVFMEPWVMGHRRAKEFLFTGGQIDAAEAYRIGMVNRVVAREDLVEATATMARTVAMQPPVALKLAKRAVNKTVDMQGFRDAIEHAFLLHVIGHGTDVFQQENWKPLLDRVATDGFKEYLKDRDRSFGQA